MFDKEKIFVLEEALSSIALKADIQASISTDSANLLHRLSKTADNALETVRKE